MGQHLDHLRELLGEVADLRSASAILGWDQQTYMPPGGNASRALQLATLDRLAHDRFVSDELGAALNAARPEAAAADPNSDDARLVRKVSRDFEKERKVPSAWVAAYSRATALAQEAWQKARSAADFAAFVPSLTEVMQLRREYAGFFAPYDHVYDPLLDDFEPGMKTGQVQQIFEAIRPVQVELIREIKERGRKVDDSLLRQPFDVQKQWDFGMQVITRFGYDFERGRQDKSTHPFTSGFSIDDVRITTRFDPNFFSSALSSSMHEAGHALYEQGHSKSLERTPLASGASLAIHESQSRMWENLVGRGLPFWKGFYPRLRQVFPECFGDVDLDDFYRSFNKVEPSLIRVDADEATYNLHIMLRFEIEIGLMQETLAIPDLPEIWNAKMQEYLGLTPPDDAKGVLQDVHWSFGLIGYFPTYALGNLIASQLWEKITADIPELDEHTGQGEFGPLRTWLREHIHQHGAKFEPMELIERVTGQPLTPEPYLHYLRSKYAEIYDLA
jgi:carboxypeptidase Taq